MSKLLLLLLIVSDVYMKKCYWNAKSRYTFFGSKTSYDTIRGDIRDYAAPDNCEAISIWTLGRHGNRNPGYQAVPKMLPVVSGIRDEIIASYDAGHSRLCAQDIENFRKWTWNTTIEKSLSELTGTGYQELYNIGRRLQQKYSSLLQGTAEQFFFRSTDEQRSKTSCAALVHGVTDGVDLKVTYEAPLEVETVVRPYHYCPKYKENINSGSIDEKLSAFFESPDYFTVMSCVQKRLGIKTQLSAENMLSMYDLCRFHSSWSTNGQDPWCAVFTNKELEILEYFDDIRLYYKDGYWSELPAELGKFPLKDLYERFVAARSGQGKKLVSYCSHNSMMIMVWCALGLYKDKCAIDSMKREPSRKWRTSYISSFSSNIIAVLNRCEESHGQTHRVQLFINEKHTPVCPLRGCLWKEFENKFQNFTLASFQLLELSNS